MTTHEIWCGEWGHEHCTCGADTARPRLVREVVTPPPRARRTDDYALVHLRRELSVERHRQRARLFQIGLVTSLAMLALEEILRWL